MTQETVKAAYRRKLASNPDGEITVDTIEIYHPLISFCHGVDVVSDINATTQTAKRRTVWDVGDNK